MIKSLAVLGRQPALGLAELESLYGAKSVSVLQPNIAGLDINTHDINFNNLGSSVKIADVLGEIPSTDWRKIEKGLLGLVRSPALRLPDSGKFHLGLSAVGLDISPAKLSALGLTLKKVIRNRHGGSVRLVPNTELELSSAQVFHNHLAEVNGAELLLIVDGDKTVVGRTIAVQNIDSYTLRDRGRPKRDARVGMLPPKLAQTIINLAVGENAKANTVLDPFCGTGVVLQESLLMGFGAVGTDVDPRMIDYTNKNLQWLSSKFELQTPNFALEVGDATSYQWSFIEGLSQDTSLVVACETYLGRPFTDTPSPAVLAQTISDVNLIIKKFLVNFKQQAPKGTRLCLAVPAWSVGRNTKHLPLLQNISELGYRRLDFKHASQADLIYRREDQIVGRELLVLKTD